MAATYFAYWGKANAEDAKTCGAPFHLAAFHMLDVAAVAERRVARSPVLRGKLARMLGIAEERVAATVAAFVALHDVGKIDVRFQLKAREVANALDPSRDSCRFKGPYDHGGWGYQQLRRELESDMSAAFGSGFDSILQAVTGHHGELPSKARRRQDEDIERFGSDDGMARAAFVADLAELFRTRGAAIPGDLSSPPFAAVALVAGVCAVADWIGSQVEYFPYVDSPIPLADYLGRALTRADVALDALRLDAPASGRAFADLFPSTPRPRDVQCVTERLDVTDQPRLVIIEAMMGAGKTEAALSLAERLLTARAASGLFFALPTMATSNSLFERLREIVPRMFGGDVNVLLAHSRTRRNEAMRRLIRASAAPIRARYSDAPFDEEASAACAKWYLSSKRALASQVGVGTVDQAMVAALRVRHHFVRLYGLSTSVVVLDEVHAYDAYMSVVLERLVEWLGALRAPVILLSATLPAARRRVFEDAYAKGAFGSDARGTSSPSDGAYPLVSVVDRAGRAPHTLPTPPSGYVLTVECIATACPLGDFLPRLVEASRSGRVAWIRNTVSEAQEAWDAACAAGAEAVLFHARMRGKDRAKAEETVLRGFGRGGDREVGLVIATQVIEQSLDLDFDLMASDLAPIDLLLQRAGRLHRHLPDEQGNGRPRPSGFERRLVVVVPTPDEVAALRFGPSRYVYDPATLWLAHDLLASREHITLPLEVRDLVEETYDPVRRAARLARGANADVLVKAELVRENARQKSEAHALGCAIPPAAFDPKHFRATEDDDDVVQALTRESASVRLLPVLWNHLDDTAATLDGEKLALDPTSPTAWREADLLQDQQISVPFYRVSGEATARGDAQAYERWRDQAHAFGRALRLGRVFLVPMKEVAGVFSGRVVARDGSTASVRYSFERGLWFP